MCNNEAMRSVRAGERIAAVVLAGGAGRRMGADKALLRLPDDRTTLAHVLEAARAIADPVLLAVDTEAHAARLGLDGSAHLLLDAQPGGGPLAALAAAMRAVDTPAIAALAVDTPLVTPALLRALHEAFGDRSATERNAPAGHGPPPRGAAPPVDAVVSLIGGMLQPMPAIYSVELAARIECLLARGRRSMHALFDDPGVRLRVLDEHRLRRVDPALRSFAGANTPEEWRQLLRLAEQEAETEGGVRQPHAHGSAATPAADPVRGRLSAPGAERDRPAPEREPRHG